MSRSDTTATAFHRDQQPHARIVSSAGGGSYGLLLKRVKNAGLLERRGGYYTWRILITALMLAAGWAAFVWVGDSWWQMVVALFLAFVFTQIGFIGHEAGHQQITASRRTNDIIGLLHADLAAGLSYGWWVDKHNRHHAHPNQEGKDPDIESGALAFTATDSGSWGPVARALYRYQAYFFFPLLLLEAVNLHVASIRAVAAGRVARHRRWEIALLAAHFVGYLAVVFLVLSPVKAVAFIAVQQGLFGLYLGCSFAPNHKGMAILSADDHSDFLRRQVLTSRNVRGGWLVDYLLGGLNYQIEHHLFPSMPRPNLRRAQPIVQEFCRQHDLPYCETGLIDSYAQALRHLDAVGRSGRVTATIRTSR
ncbi:fatty acid desaturase family protein [Phytohabitans houttuyneae]|uniref:Fatty acid desaturase n=1 Tax=Phytohabitans houttuyneae TaxID=1076126 RepID=A0A6V8KGU2_9ACTN|nr:acyl-CoA desaturase [Phytohabitans houttuyneae]GFJ80917.1 fatty acid desaturase [Phytohabitans houttuyneae]